MNVQTAPHEGDVHFIFTDNGLKPYYAANRVDKDHGEDWKTSGKPVATTRFNGDEYALCMDYYEGGLDPWENPDFQLETVREYQFYFVNKASPHYDGDRADRADRTQGGTITMRPRWPDLKSDGTPVSVPDYGCAYVDLQVQASNIPHRDYRELLTSVMSAFGLPARFFDTPHPDSNVADLARYVRLRRGESGPIYAPDGPIARSHNLIQGDRTGYRKHVEDHTKIPGYYVTSVIEDAKADELIRGHGLGKELKHYYPNHPDNFESNEAPYHPKFEVSYQTSQTRDTLRWSELDDAIRELDETILNCLDWAGIGTVADTPEFVGFDPYWSVENTHKSRKSVSCPLPDIEDEQEAVVMSLWGDMTDAGEATVEHLLSDGGKSSMGEVAEDTGYTYRTIRAVVKRLSELIEQSYGELQFQSKKISQELKNRVQAAGERFKQAIGSTVSDIADAERDAKRSAWSAWKKKFAVSEIDNRKDCRYLLRIGYKPESRAEAAEILRDAFRAAGLDRTLERGVKAQVEYTDGTGETFTEISHSVLKRIGR